VFTKLTARNFKVFDDVEIELGNPVVFIGPNNSGKTSALQALALWDVGLRRWLEKRGGRKAPEKRPGVTINRRDLLELPIPHADLLWHNLRVRNVEYVEGKPKTDNVFIDLIVEGITENRPWGCGLEFYYANEESFYCRPLRKANGKNPERMRVPEEAARAAIAFLPPMSGLAANETRLDPGAVAVRIGEGRTAEVLRNLCHSIHDNNEAEWEELVSQIRQLFGCELHPPAYVAERGEIEMGYREKGHDYDLSSSGRGLQQTLLVLAYMYSNPGAVLLLDEPDAHLEILRQRQVYQLLSETAVRNGNQVIAASHSEVLLNEAAGRDTVVAFVGKPHVIGDRGSQVLKALTGIGFEHYYQAEEAGWVLYLEGSTDTAILRSFAQVLEHEAALEALDMPFVHYVLNQPDNVRKHFHGLREAVPGLLGIALFDRLDRVLPSDLGVEGLVWKRREIESYFCHEEVLLAYAEAAAEADSPGPLFTPTEQEKRLRAMREAIKSVSEAMKTLGKGSPWAPDCKVSDDFLAPLSAKYFDTLGLPNMMRKGSYHELAHLVRRAKLEGEVKEKLDRIAAVHRAADAGR
jgi:predicted ATPase